jgi:hypothetical protein
VPVFRGTRRVFGALSGHAGGPDSRHYYVGDSLTERELSANQRILYEAPSADAEGASCWATPALLPDDAVEEPVIRHIHLHVTALSGGLGIEDLAHGLGVYGAPRHSDRHTRHRHGCRAGPGGH